MPSLILLLTMTARAGGLHAGVPVDQNPELADVQFEGPDQGWSAALTGPGGAVSGFVRVYVGPTQAAAARWMEDAARGVQRPLTALAGLGDEARGDPAALVLTRDGNVAVMVRTTDPEHGVAEELARTLLGRIEDEPHTWPAAARIEHRAGLWYFDPADAVFTSVTGGRRPLGEADGYAELPSAVVTWDRWGRAAVLLPQP